MLGSQVLESFEVPKLPSILVESFGVSFDDHLMKGISGILKKLGTKNLRHLCGLSERWAENALRIALVLHCMEHAGEAGSHPVDGSTMERAISIIRWFIGREMAWMESSGNEDPVAEKLKARVYQYLRDHGPTTARELGRSAGLKSKWRYLLDKWVEAGELDDWNASKGARRSPTYALKGDDRIPSEIAELSTHAKGGPYRAYVPRNGGALLEGPVCP